MNKLWFKTIGLVFVILLAFGCQTSHSGRSPNTTVLVGAILNGETQGDPDTQAAVRLATQDVNRYLESVDSDLRISLRIESSGLNPDLCLQALARLKRAGAAIVGARLKDP